MVSEGQTPSQCCLTKLPREMCSQPLENKALSWGIIRKSACILAEITIRKSQKCVCRATREVCQVVTFRIIWHVPFW